MSFMVFHSAEDWAARHGASGRGSVLAIGNFDGIHLGHQAILRGVVERAKERGGVATALTFEPPPLKLLRPEAAPLRLSTNEQRLTWFRANGLEAAVVLRFTMELARLSPEDFVRDILVRGLHLRAVLVGENFRFGHRQAGDVRRLGALAGEQGITVVIVQLVPIRGDMMWRSWIRRDVADGNGC